MYLVRKAHVSGLGKDSPGQYWADGLSCQYSVFAVLARRRSQENPLRSPQAPGQGRVVLEALWFLERRSGGAELAQT